MTEEQAALVLIAALTGLAGPARAAVTAPGDSPASPASAAAAPPQGASDPSATPHLPGPLWGATAVRLDLSGQFFGASAVEVELSRRFGRLSGVDVAVGETDMGYGYTGFAADLMGRLYLFNEARGGVSWAAGPWLRTATAYGPMAFLSGELAVEYRPRRGFSILGGGGMSVALNNSGTAACPDSGLLGCFLWRDHVARGDTTVNLRLAVGASF